ncbi:diguanylate cyclase [Niallia sp. FSL W8-0635]|uniref:diguanylate cyclase n=1 Tax=Niallia sp. FSL W8-0635 TaxID=2975337 RepID=UPI0030F4B5EF
MIIKDLVSNLSILVSLLFLYSQITKQKPLNRQSSINRKLTTGIVGGILGNILMQYSIHIDDAIIDLRHIPIMILAFYGGAIPAFISMILIMIGRLFLGINLATFCALALISLSTLGAVFFTCCTISTKNKIISCLSWNNFIFTIFAIYLIKEWNILLVLIPTYWIISYLGGFIGFYVINHLRSIQLLFEKYRNESTTDGLTGLNNYRNFDHLFNSLIKQVDAREEKLSLLYIDIDFFKKINDRYGHIKGDEILKKLGEILKKCTKSYDVVSRNGGEEFTVLLLDCPLEKAKEMAENIRKTVEAYPFYALEEEIHITVSIGIACYNETTIQAIDIIDDADRALYYAKNSGRNKVCIANHFPEKQDVLPYI